MRDKFRGQCTYWGGGGVRTGRLEKGAGIRKLYSRKRRIQKQEIEENIRN
jgi:hypothetical protein